MNRTKRCERAERDFAPDARAMQHELTNLRQQVEFLKELPNWTAKIGRGNDHAQIRSVLLHPAGQLLPQGGKSVVYQHSCNQSAQSGI